MRETYLTSEPAAVVAVVVGVLLPVEPRDKAGVVLLLYLSRFQQPPSLFPASRRT